MAGDLVRRFDGEEDLAVALAEHIAELSNAAILERGVFTIALSGGPLIPLLRKLTKPPYLQTVEWPKWIVFWAEEKYESDYEQTPHAMPHQSNYELANEEFLSKVPIFPSQIKAMPQNSPSIVPDEYELTIRKMVREGRVNACVANDCPKFDLVLLVLGSDGRISSLKPDQTGLDKDNPWVCSVFDEGDEKHSVTLSPTVINSSANVAVVVTGEAFRLMRTVRTSRTAVVTTAPVSFLTKEVVVWFMNETAWLGPLGTETIAPSSRLCRFD